MVSRGARRIGIAEVCHLERSRAAAQSKDLCSDPAPGARSFAALRMTRGGGDGGCGQTSPPSPAPPPPQCAHWGTPKTPGGGGKIRRRHTQDPLHRGGKAHWLAMTSPSLPSSQNSNLTAQNCGRLIAAHTESLFTLPGGRGRPPLRDHFSLFRAVEDALPYGRRGCGPTRTPAPTESLFTLPGGRGRPPLQNHRSQFTLLKTQISQLKTAGG